MTGVEALADWIRRVGDRKYLTNEWLYADDLKVYVRKGFHMCGQDSVLPVDQRQTSTPWRFMKPLVCLDLASIEVYEKKQGVFTAFLEAAHAMNPWEATYIECVQNDFLTLFLEKKGFIRQGDELVPNFYLLKG